MKNNIDPKSYDIRFWRLLALYNIILCLVMATVAAVFVFAGQDVGILIFTVIIASVAVFFLFYSFKASIDVMKEGLLKEIRESGGELLYENTISEAEDIGKETLGGGEIAE